LRTPGCQKAIAPHFERVLGALVGTGLFAMAGTPIFKVYMNMFNEQCPPRTRPKTDRDREPESRTRPKTDPIEIARLKMINSLNLEQDAAKAAKATKKAVKAMK
jgi:hypothetical protein